MKKIYFSFLLLLLGFSHFHETRAAHMLGTEVGYTCIAPNLYSVRLKAFRECGSLNLPATLNVNLKAAGCNNGRNLAVTRIGNRFGNPYCAQQPVTCTINGLPNFEELTYTGNLVFTPAEAACPDWVISFSECNRGNSRNIQNSQSFCMYVDSYLKLTPGINNNSAEFTSLEILNIAWNEKVTFSTFALDPDGDSLVYSLQSALSNATTPVTYETGYSGSSPIASSPAMQIDPRTGSITLIPILPPVPGSNHHSVVVQVEEYREINGLVTKIGSTKREMIMIVVNSQVGGISNSNPYTTNATVNGQLHSPGAVIQAQVGVPLTFEVEGFDPNPGDILTMTSNAALLLSGATFTTSGTPVKGTITWTPTINYIDSKPHYFHINLKDDFCTTRGVHTQTYAVQVNNSQNPTGIAEKISGLPLLTVFPNPFSEQVSFKISSGKGKYQLKIYNTLGQLVDQLDLENSTGSGNVMVWKDAARFSAGAYVAMLISGNKTVQTVKFNRL